MTRSSYRVHLGGVRLIAVERSGLAFVLLVARFR